MIIRKATLNDCKHVWDMCRIPQLVNPSGEPPRLWWIKSFVKEKQIFFIAEESGELAGFILGERTCGQIGYLWMLAVKPRFQGKGIGKELFLTAEKECKKRRLKAILLYGYEKSPRALKIIKSLKYEKGRKYYEFLKFI
jgi:ribosomal protein S18 acetylase RimI-like enzyme